MTASCYVCGAPVIRRRVGIAELALCQRCGLGRVIDAEPASDYWTRADDAERELDERYWEARLPVCRRALLQIGRETGPGRVVDVGGGVGHFAASALELGWDAYTVDVSEQAAHAAARRVGPERSLRAAPDDMTGTCDVVTLWCVIAHVPDPRALLGNSLRLLKSGGRLLLTTPNFLFQAPYASLSARLGRPVDFAASDHVWQFTPKSIDLVLGQCGARRRAFAYWGTTADCLFERRLAPALVPGKRVWNWTTWNLSRLGVRPLYSELQVQAGV